MLMVATVPLEEPHSTDVVTSWMLPSLNVPVAANWRFVSSGMVGDVGVTAMETRVAAVTVSVAYPFTLAAVAVMVA